MLKGIFSIAGKPGLYRLVTAGKGTMVVEQLGAGKRLPVHARDRVISLQDVAMFTEEEDVPLAQVLDSLKTQAEGKEVDIKAVEESGLREFFGKVLPNFDRERVHISDIRKLLSWYNILISSGVDTFVEEEAPAAE